MEVNTRALRDASEALRNSSSQANRTLHEIEEIRYRLREMSNVDEFRWVIQKVERNLSETENSISNMAFVLESICDRYDATENRVREKSGSMRRRTRRATYLSVASLPSQSAFVSLKRTPAIREIRPVLKCINMVR